MYLVYFEAISQVQIEYETAYSLISNITRKELNYATSDERHCRNVSIFNEPCSVRRASDLCAESSEWRCETEKRRLGDRQGSKRACVSVQRLKVEIYWTATKLEKSVD